MGILKLNVSSTRMLPLPVSSGLLLVSPLSPFASLRCARERTEAQLYSSSLLFLKFNFLPRFFLAGESRSETWKLWERRKGIVARIDVNRRPIILPGGDKVTSDRGKSNRFRERKKPGVYFISIVFIADDTTIPAKDRHSCSPCINVNELWTAIRCTYVAPGCGERSTGRYRRKPAFAIRSRCATPLNAACHLFDPLPHPPRSRTYATFIALVSALTAAKLHYLFTGH